ITLTSGTAFLMWLGEQITANGVGNGISIIIFAGIVAAVPNGVKQLYSQYFINPGDELFINILIVALICLVIIAVTLGVIYVQRAERNICIIYQINQVAYATLSEQSTLILLSVGAACFILVHLGVVFIRADRVGAIVFEGIQAASVVENIFHYLQSVGMIPH